MHGFDCGESYSMTISPISSSSLHYSDLNAATVAAACSYLEHQVSAGSGTLRVTYAALLPVAQENIGTVFI